jgi:carbamoyltransferase
LVKKREDFRPFAPAVPEEHAATYFEIDEGEERTYAHMLFVADVRSSARGLLPAVTHVDGSARVQVVCRRDHPRFWTVLQEFGRITGVPVLLNTSFNGAWEPIVCSPEEAIRTFFAAGLDALVIGQVVLVRRHE